MIHLNVTYRIRKSHADEARQRIAALAAAVKKHEPRTLNYQVFQHASEESVFTHSMDFPNPEAHHAHISAPHVKQFVEALVTLCEDGPHYVEMKPLG